MDNRIVWGVVDGAGVIVSSNDGFKLTRTEVGEYNLTFNPPFSCTPAICGNQVLSGNTSQKTTDTVVFPFVKPDMATVTTGDSNGNREDRNFSFIAVGTP